jgi:hypothetical protein
MSCLAFPVCRYMLFSSTAFQCHFTSLFHSTPWYQQPRCARSRRLHRILQLSQTSLAHILSLACFRKAVNIWSATSEADQVALLTASADSFHGHQSNDQCNTRDTSLSSLDTVSVCVTPRVSVSTAGTARTRAAVQVGSAQMDLSRHPKLSVVNILRYFISCHDCRGYIHTTYHVS